MDKIDRFIILMIIIIFFSLSIAVIKTAYGLQERVQEIKTERVHLPSLCAEHYGTGSDNWIECMEVGYD